jgi:hypothetical protein
MFLFLCMNKCLDRGYVYGSAMVSGFVQLVSVYKW